MLGLLGLNGFGLERLEKRIGKIPQITQFMDKPFQLDKSHKPV